MQLFKDFLMMLDYDFHLSVRIFLPEMGVSSRVNANASF